MDILRSKSSQDKFFKACTQCHQIKPLDDFSPRARKRDGRSSWCRACYAARQRKRYIPHPRPKKPLPVSEKVCPTCDIVKPLEDFYRNESMRDRRAHECKACRALRDKGRNQREKSLRHAYGITNQEYQDMFVRQFGLCAICNRPPKEGKVLHVDHCHVSGVIRGLLCAHCNHMLGYARDDISTLKNAINYLKKNST